MRTDACSARLTGILVGEEFTAYLNVCNHGAQTVRDVVVKAEIQHGSSPPCLRPSELFEKTNRPVLDLDQPVRYQCKRNRMVPGSNYTVTSPGKLVFSTRSMHSVKRS